MTYNPHKAEWAARRQMIRKGVVRVLKDIEKGEVSDMDLARLHNFCQCSLSLLAKVDRPVWESAKRDAELASLLHNECESLEDFAVRTASEGG